MVKSKNVITIPLCSILLRGQNVLSLGQNNLSRDKMFVHEEEWGINTFLAMNFFGTPVDTYNF